MDLKKIYFNTIDFIWIRFRSFRAKIRANRYFVPLSIIFTTLTIIVFHQTNFISTYLSVVTQGTNDKEAYLINTPGCVIQNFDVHSAQFAKYIKQYPKKFSCGDQPELTEATGLTLLLHKERAEKYNIEPSKLKCSYQGITAQYVKGTVSINKPILGEPVDITDKETSIEHEGILVTCYNAANVTKPIYLNVHYFVQRWKVQKKIQDFKQLYGDRTSQSDKLSVLILGIDSLSRFNFLRHMPETYRYVMEELNGLDFRGYNKQGTNTKPNLISIMVGVSQQEINETKYNLDHKDSFYSPFPSIWKDFHYEGYATAFADDVSGCPLFNALDIDYFQRTAFSVSQKHIAHFMPTYGFQYAPCQMNKMSSQVIFDYTLDIARTLKDVPYFGFFYAAAITHEHLMMPQIIDKPVKSLLQTLKEEGLLNHTALILMSDHGARFGNLRNTYLGNLEVNLPTLAAVFPPWFKGAYPRAWKNMVTNTGRLISNFDFHQTLHDLASRDYVLNKIRPVEPNHGQSLFREVPDTRTCSDVGIPPQLCTCELYEEAKEDDPEIEAAAKFAVEHLNTGLAQFKDCVELELDKVLSARKSTGNNATKVFYAKQVVTTFLLVLQTRPSAATLESLVREKDGSYEILGEIDRTNRYGNQSHCITDEIYRQYCYCKDLLKT